MYYVCQLSRSSVVIFKNWIVLDRPLKIDWLLKQFVWWDEPGVSEVDCSKLETYCNFELDIWLLQDQWQEPLKMVEVNRPVDIAKLCYVNRVGLCWSSCQKIGMAELRHWHQCLISKLAFSIPLHHIYNIHGYIPWVCLPASGTSIVCEREQGYLCQSTGPTVRK